MMNMCRKCTLASLQQVSSVIMFSGFYKVGSQNPPPSPLIFLALSYLSPPHTHADYLSIWPPNVVGHTNVCDTQTLCSCF